MTTSQDKARLFHQLHHAESPLVLVNVWDAAGARLVAGSGAAAVATASASASWSLGHQDGGHLPRAEAVALTARVARSVDLPVTADLEGGYGDDAAEVGRTIEQILEAGAVGVNLEDGGGDPEGHAERVAAARAAADAAGIALFVNARTDLFLRGIGDPATRLEEAVARARRYLDAGADGVFVPGVTDPATVSALASSIPAPLNVLARPGGPAVAELAAAGAARISLGPAPALAAYTALRTAAREVYASGTYRALAADLDFAALNSLMA